MKRYLFTCENYSNWGIYADSTFYVKDFDNVPILYIIGLKKQQMQYCVTTSKIRLTRTSNALPVIGAVLTLDDLPDKYLYIGSCHFKFYSLATAYCFIPFTGVV